MSGLVEKYTEAVLAFHDEVRKFLGSPPPMFSENEPLLESTYQLGLNKGVYFVICAFGKHSNVVRELIANELMQGRER